MTANSDDPRVATNVATLPEASASRSRLKDLNDTCLLLPVPGQVVGIIVLNSDGNNVLCEFDEVKDIYRLPLTRIEGEEGFEAGARRRLKELVPHEEATDESWAVAFVSVLLSGPSRIPTLYFYSTEENSASILDVKTSVAPGVNKLPERIWISIDQVSTMLFVVDEVMLVGEAIKIAIASGSLPKNTNVPKWDRESLLSERNPPLVRGG